MVVVLTAAVVLMISGTTFLRDVLDPHERPGWFVCFWLACSWLTVTAILLAMFDLLMLRSGARKAERQLRREIEDESVNRSPNH
jgi:hypothetical protein